MKRGGEKVTDKGLDEIRNPKKVSSPLTWRSASDKQGRGKKLGGEKMFRREVV